MPGDDQVFLKGENVEPIRWTAIPDAHSGCSWPARCGSRCDPDPSAHRENLPAVALRFPQRSPTSMFQTSLRIPCRAACLIGSIPRSHACPQSFSLLATAQTALSLAFARTRKSVHSIELNTSLLETRRNNSTSAWSLISLWPFRSSWAAIRCSSFEETATLFIWL